MKKTIRFILLTIFTTALLVATLILVGCNKNNQSNIVELRVEDARINFMCGDTFETGDDFKVYAEYKDGSVEDVTDRVTVNQESGMDMSVAGDYQITVIFEGKREIYTVYVNDSEDILRRIELDTDEVKTQYKLGEEVSFDGLVLSLTYENSQGATFVEETTSLNGLNVAIVGDNDLVIDDVFTSLGTFTVTVSRGNVKATFDMTVKGVNISTVQSALTVGDYFSRDVVSGDIHVQGARMYLSEDSPLQPGEPFTTERYEITFGNNYTRIKELHNSPSEEYHCSMDEEGFFVTYLKGGVVSTSNRNNSSMMSGAPLLLWYNSETEYGLENTLNNLYSHALKCTNNDLKQTADESNKTYSFSFSGLEQRDRSYDYYETTVTFKLGEDYAVSSVEITQDYYENNSSLAEQEGYTPTFTTDESGKTTPNGDYSYRTIITATQTTGERTAQNSYGRDMFKVASYKLKYNGVELADNAVLECSAGSKYTLDIVDVTPETANLAVDLLKFNYEGNHGNDDIWIYTEHFSVMQSGSQITISTKHGGTWTVLIKTEKTTRKLILKIEGSAPQDMQPKLFNSASGTFYDGSEKTITVGGEAYFYGAVDQYANSAQTATVVSENAEYATVTKTTAVGVDCWKFTATQEGTYQVKVVSDVAELVSYVFTFTVSQTDLNGMLNGTYTVQDRVGDIYTVTFTTDGDEAIGGSVSVTRTPTDESDNPIAGQAVTQTFTYSVEGLNIAVSHQANDVIWVDFAVDENNNLVLIDQRDARYVLTRTSENA